MPDVILNLLPVREEEKAAFEAAAPDAVHLYAGRRTATPEQFAQATIVMGWPRAEMLAQAPRLRWFHCMWAGTDQYTDTVPPSVLMTSSAGTNSQSVAEHMLASLLSLYRKIPQCRDQQRDHAWIDVGDMKSLAGAGRGPCGLRLRPAVQGPGGRAHHRAEADGGRPRPRL